MDSLQVVILMGMIHSHLGVRLLGQPHKSFFQTFIYFAGFLFEVVVKAYPEDDVNNDEHCKPDDGA